MKKEKLIELLQSLPAETEVLIMDRCDVYSPEDIAEGSLHLQDVYRSQHKGMSGYSWYFNPCKDARKKSVVILDCF